MQVISYTSIRKNLSNMMEKICTDHVPITVTRAKAKPVVMVSLEDYEAIAETHYLMKSPNNAARLAEAIDEIEAMISERNKCK